MNSNLLTIQERAANIMKSVGYETESLNLIKGGPGSGRKIGKTSSGKDVYGNANHKSHDKFNARDHLDAANLHSGFKSLHYKEARRMGDGYSRHMNSGNAGYMKKLKEHEEKQSHHYAQALTHMERHLKADEYNDEDHY